jgi:superkiller protein 3
MNEFQKIALRLILLVILGTLLVSGPSVISVTQNLQDAQSWFAVGNYQEQANHLIQAAQAYPWWKAVWEDIGLAAYRAGDFPLAVESFEKSHQFGSISSQGLILLGEAYLEMGEDQDAEDIWKELEDTPQALQNLALFYENQGKFTEAISAWEKYLDLNQDDLDLDLFYHYALLLAAELPPQAVVYLDQSAEDYPEAGLISEAIKSSLGEDTTYQYISTGQVLASIGEWRLAAYALEQAATLTPDYLEAYVYWGEVLQHINNPDPDPRDVLERALEIDQNSPLANMFMGMYWQRQGNHSQALVFFEKAEQSWSEYPGIYLEQGKSQAALGNLEEALIEFQTAIELAPLEPIYYHQLAEFCVRYAFQVQETGLPAARVAVQLDDQDPANLDVLGQVLLELEDQQNAIRLYNRALEVDPTFAPAYYHLGILYSAMDNPDKAIYYLQQVLVYSNNPAIRDQAERLLATYLP